MMKMNFKHLMMSAAAAAVALTGCSMEGDEAGKLIADGQKALFSITVSGPETYAATDANASGYEVEVETIDVFIYSTGMTYVDHAKRSKTDGQIEWVESDKVWRVTDEYPIPTTAGTKVILVGLNLPNGVVSSIVDNSLDGEKTITTIAQLAGNNSLAMFSTEPVSKELIATEEGEDDVINEVSTTVSRLVSKIVFFHGEESRKYIATNDEGELTNLEFTATNVNNKFFLMSKANYSDPNFTVANMIEGGFLSYGVDAAIGFKNVNWRPTLPINDIEAVYATENTAVKGAKSGAFTYAIVKGIYTPAKVCNWEDDTLNDDVPVVVGKTFYAVRYLVDDVRHTVFFYDEDNALDFVKEDIGNTTDPEKHIQEYVDGICYYSVFFTGEEKGNASTHSIYRNTMYRVTVDAVKGLGSHTWEPGEPDPLFPPIVIPEEKPEDEEEGDALLVVKVGIEPWALEAPQSTVLGD